MTTQTLAPLKVDLKKVIALLKESRQQKRTYRRSLNVALFVHQTENCGTEDVMLGLRLGGDHNWRPGGSVVYAMVTTRLVLISLEKIGVLVKELVTMYVPPFSTKYGKANVMGGRSRKDGRAVWRVHPDLLVDEKEAI